MDKNINKILKEFKRRIPLDFSSHIKEIRCFGSYARGEARKDSDLDVLIVIDKDDENIEEKIDDIAYQTMWDFNLF